MILGVPVYEHHALTAQMIASLAETVQGPDFTLVIVDNASPTPYRRDDYDVPFRLRVIRNARNEGNFYPLAQVGAAGHSLVALGHNDMLYYEPGWNLRVEAAFRDDPALGLVGFAGSWAINADGERAIGTTMSNLRGAHGRISAEHAGVRITDLRPSVAVDGLFMAFRREALAALTLNPSLPPAHWYDYIWGAQIIEAGWHQATLGVEVDHTGWSTEVGLATELDAEWRRWAADQGVDPGANVMEAIWATGRASWVNGFGGRFFPCDIGAVQ